MKTLVTTLLALFISTVTFAEETPTTLAGTTVITAEDLLDLSDTKADLVIVDARVQSDYDKSHIPGVVRLVNTETTETTLATVIPSKITPVIFYCNGPSCKRSYESAGIAVASGYSNVYWFRGGIAEWTQKDYPVESN